MNTGKKSWVSPSLERLDVSKTLGGLFTNFSETQFGIPGEGGEPVPLGRS